LPVGGKGASVVALSAEDGSTVWTAGDEPASYCGALPISFEGRPLVVALLENVLTVIDRQTGELLWKQKLSRGYDEHAAWPIYDEPRLTIMTPFRKGSKQFVLEPSGDGTGGQLGVRRSWESTQMSNDVASSVLYDGHVYGFDLRDIQTKARRASRGTFRAMDFRTGEVVWSSDRPGQASLVVADGKLLMLNDQGDAILARATPKEYEELGRANVFGDELCWTAPTLSRGRLYLRSPTRAACLYVGKPERLSPAGRSTARSTSEIAKPRRWDLWWLVGGERPFPFDLPDFRELGRWYGYSVLGVFGISAVVAALAYLVTRRRWPRAGRLGSRAAFWSLLVVLGLVGTPWSNRLSEEFVFTWPVVLFVVHQLALTAIVWAHRETHQRGSPVVVVVATLLFFAVGVAYFHLCQRLDLAVLWVFLMGFVPSWLVAVPAAYGLRRDRCPGWDFFWALASFSAYFWCTAALIAWWLALD
ncbi:MAG: PQQ-binding-like beta-propeller repeat protein, partial [Pirellulales bacterium]|nr:PQQ-binding-like beta-propeller repeat protein [Pirellulales bacterium]